MEKDKVTTVKVDHSHVGNLIGRVLTLVDATYSDKKQRDAQKSLMVKTIKDWLYDQYEEQYPDHHAIRGYGVVELYNN